jgi:hypothetical protein
LRIDIRIDEYTSDEEARELINLLAEEGQDALRLKLEKIDKGQISPPGRVGNDLAVVRSLNVKGRRVIRLVTARYMSFFELYRGGRSTDHPIGIIELNLDDEGKGDGIVIMGAEAKFDDNNVLQITSLGNQYVKLVNVRMFR